MESRNTIGVLVTMLAVLSSVVVARRFTSPKDLGPPAESMCDLELTAHVNQKVNMVQLLMGLLSIACFALSIVIFSGAPTVAQTVASVVVSGLGTLLLLVATQRETPCESPPLK